MKKTIIKSAKTKDLAIKEALEDINKSLDEVSVEVLEEESSGFLGLIGQKDALVKITYEDSYQEDFEEIKEELIEDPIITDFDSKETDEFVGKTPIYQDEDDKEHLYEEDESIKDTKEDLSSLDDEVYEEDGQLEEDIQKSNIEKYYRSKDFLKEMLQAMHFENVRVIGNLEDNIIKLDAKIDERDTGIAIGKGGKTIEAIELLLRKSLRARANDLKINIDINNYKKRRDDKIIEQADHAARKVLKTKKRWNLKYMNSYERRLAHEQISKYDKLTSHSEGQEPNRYVVVDLIEE